MRKKPLYIAYRSFKSKLELLLQKDNLVDSNLHIPNEFRTFNNIKISKTKIKLQPRITN